MNLYRHIADLLLPVFLVLAPCHGLAKTIPPLAEPPLGEQWFSISMSDERTGFDHYAIGKLPGGYEISTSGSVKMVVLGFSRQASSRATYLVKKDLSLSSFEVEQTIDGKPMRLTGKATAGGVTVMIESAGESRNKVLKTKGPVYPPPVVNLYPMMKGVAPKKKYRIQMLDVEEIKIKEVKVIALGEETLPDGTETLHFRNDLYPFVDNDVWVDLAGNTVKESVRGGLIDTKAEPGPAARQFIADAALAKQDLMFDFSLVRIDRPQLKPLELKKLTLELAGFPDTMPLISDERQKGVRLGGDRVTFSVSNLAEGTVNPVLDPGVPGNGKFLESSDRILSNHAEIIAEKNRILAEEKDGLKTVQALVRWVAETIGENAADRQAALEVLRSKKGNCQSRARLYAALARAAGIPTRVVAGLVYLPEKGFLYHSWAESYTGCWLAVDPTYNQVPADVTHVKLVEGDTSEGMAAIAGLVGRIQAKIVEEKY